MSLILAEVAHDFGWFVGDTLLTKGLPIEYSDRDINNESHALKVHILDGKVCIAFAGIVSLAFKVISHVNTLIESGIYTFNDDFFDRICNIYKELCPENELHSCDFLVMVIRDDGNVLAKIEKGKWSKCQRAYIGDSEFYRKIQSKRVPYTSLSPVFAPDGSHTYELTKMSDIVRNSIEIATAMEKISGRVTVGLIGDNVVRVGINSNNVFNYLSKVYGYISVENTEVKKRIGATLLSSSNPKFGIGIYYSEGSVGYIFISGDTECCRRIHANNLSEFKNNAQAFSLTLC